MPTTKKKQKKTTGAFKSMPSPKKPAVQEVDVTIVLDRSGSMESIASDVIGGFNAFVAEQAKVPGCLITLHQFNHEWFPVHAMVPANLFPALNKDTYRAEGNTALWDAMARSMIAAESRRALRTIIVVYTDGLENSSKEFKLSDIQAMVKRFTAAGWQFIFLGANQDAVMTGREMEIKTCSSVTVGISGQSVANTWRQTTNKVASFRASGNAKDLEYNAHDRAVMNVDKPTT